MTVRGERLYLGRPSSRLMSTKAKLLIALVALVLVYKFVVKE
ncbi:hypothetical protein HSR122_1279 [Halapricum desulfuricans]|uniref:Uncharacterized protein n=1 Tax=Halapricum desulfuricans TaxID=2841257 RepID=A0A897N7I6_9EURY|nr:hypothetical protein HSR122_1279 [Halapricum desulfuricans]